MMITVYIRKGLGAYAQFDDWQANWNAMGCDQ